jgi:GWxTD domain-containing protein
LAYRKKQQNWSNNSGNICKVYAVKQNIELNSKIGRAAIAARPIFLALSLTLSMGRTAALCFFLLLIIAVSCSRTGENSYQQQYVQKSTAPGVRPELRMQYTWYATPDSLNIYLLFSDVSRIIDLKRTAKSLSYDITKSGEGVVLRDTLRLPPVPETDNDNGLYLNVQLPLSAASENSILNMRLWQQFAGQERSGTSFKIQLQPIMLEKNMLLIRANGQQPFLRNYINTNDVLLLRSIKDSAIMKVHFFDAAFSPALPPMSMSQEAQARTLKIGDSITVKATDTLKLEREGLYLLWPGETYSRGLLVEAGLYPKVTKAAELVQPLIYLTTSTERDKMTRAQDPKKVVDDFWMQLAGEKNLARELIRTYYGRVEHANTLYTSHKPGWATDRGMIYIVYGPPNDISRAGATETWIYRESEMQPYVKFVFTKKQNNFTENHYELIRRREYEESWYSSVAKWRAGITDQ